MMRILSNKKGEFNLDPIVVGVMTLLMAGFLFVMGLIIMDEIQVDVADYNAVVTNETLTTVDELGEKVANVGACGFNSFVLGLISNDTDSNIGAGNFTSRGPRTGIVYSMTGVDADLNNTDINVSYTYKFGNNTACEAINQTIMGQGKFADYIDLIVLAVIISVIIGLIMIGFAARGIR